MEELDRAIDGVISCIKESFEYQRCISLKEKMQKNALITGLVDDIKRLQKDYIRSGYSQTAKEKLDEVNEKLQVIPIYNVYLDNLSKVNQRIDFVKDVLNDYFYKLLNDEEA